MFSKSFSLALALMATLFSTALYAGTYIVQPRDTLSGIATRFDTTVSELARLNGLSNRQFIKVGQSLKVPDTFKTYTIKSGDNLSSIAIRNGLRLQDLIMSNPGIKPNLLQVGAKIKIPLKPSSAATKPPVHTLPYALRKSLDRIPVNNQRWKYVVVHHSATKRGSMKGLDRYHREERRMENGLAYHFVIGNGTDMGNGEIGIGNRWKKQIQGGHLASEAMNRKAIGICLIGNFQTGHPTKFQMEQLEALLDYLMKRCRLPFSAVRTHTQINVKPTACPGKNFSLKEIEKVLRH